LNGWVSPALGIRFDPSGSELTIFGPDERPFLSYPDLAAQNDRMAEKLTLAASERDQIASERDQIASERDQIASEREQIASERDRLAAQLRALGVEP
jgi:hypothetical protein